LYSSVPLLRFRYGAYLSREEVAEVVAPHKDTLELVHSWLGHHGVPSSSISTSHGGNWLTITDVPISKADKLLCASYQLYRHTGTNETEPILRTVSYALPAALHGHVQMIAPTTYFPSPRKPLQTPRKRSSKEAAVIVNATGKLVKVPSRRDDDPIFTPSFLRSLYKTEAYVPIAMDKNGLGILGLNNDYPRQEDLTEFMTKYRTDAAAATFTVVQVNSGGYNQNNPGREASLDIQYAGAISYPTPHIFYSTGGPMRWSPITGIPSHRDAHFAWLSFLLIEQNVPPTVSLSFGDFESVFPPAYTKTMCLLFAALGLRGVSILTGSGDDGVGPAEHVQFLLCNLCSPEGRGIPDIAAQAYRLPVIVGGSQRILSGTSCSTPVRPFLLRVPLCSALFILAWACGRLPT
jgi:tripeptidyl-peptidase-1